MSCRSPEQGKERLYVRHPKLRVNRNRQRVRCHRASLVGKTKGTKLCVLRTLVHRQFRQRTCSNQLVTRWNSRTGDRQDLTASQGQRPKPIRLASIHVQQKLRHHTTLPAMTPWVPTRHQPWACYLWLEFTAPTTPGVCIPSVQDSERLRGTLHLACSKELRVRDNSKKKGKLKLLQKPNGRRSKLKKKRRKKRLTSCGC